MDGAADVAIAAGKILSVGKAPDGFTANRVIDARGLVVAPGLVDLSARLREPGFEYKATLESELKAALHGGVTSLACPPDTEPVLDEPGLVEMLRFRAKRLEQSNVYPLGALTLGLKGEIITEMSELSHAGCIGFGQADAPITNTQVLMRAMQYAHTFGYTVWLRPQDAWLGKGGVAHSGPVAARLGAVGRVDRGRGRGAADDFRTGPHDRLPRASVPAFERARHRPGSGRQARRPAHHGRCER